MDDKIKEQQPQQEHQNITQKKDPAQIKVAKKESAPKPQEKESKEIKQPQQELKQPQQELKQPQQLKNEPTKQEQPQKMVTQPKNLTKAASDEQPKGHEFSIALQQARAAKGWTQQQLAQEISEKKTIIQELEIGKIQPNNSLLIKLEKALGVKFGKETKKPAVQQKNK